MKAILLYRKKTNLKKYGIKRGNFYYPGPENQKASKEFVNLLYHSKYKKYHWFTLKMYLKIHLAWLNAKKRHREKAGKT